MVIRVRLLASAISCCVLLFVSSVSAQSAVTPDSLRGLLVGLGARSSAVTGIPVPEVAGQIATFAELTSLEVATAPFGTSSDAFSFTFDSKLGTFTRVTQSFGPEFARRSLTAGKGKFSVGFNWLHANYNSLGGQDLSNGDLLAVRNVKNLPISIASTPLKVDLSSDTFVSFATFGLTNDFDIGVVVPWVRITMAADLGYLSASNVDVTPGGHLLVVPKTSASGIGDIGILGKYHFWHQGAGGLAAGFDVRLSTGDTANLRGTGVTRTLVSAIWSRGGKVSPHVDVGYEFWSSAVPISATGDVFAKNQVKYAFGVEVQAHSRMTALIDVVGRTQLHGGQVGYRTLTFGPGSFDLLLPLPNALQVISLAPGIKWNVAGNVLLAGNVLTSLVNKGLRANVIPVVGLEWAF